MNVKQQQVQVHIAGQSVPAMLALEEMKDPSSETEWRIEEVAKSASEIGSVLQGILDKVYAYPYWGLNE